MAGGADIAEAVLSLATAAGWRGGTSRSTLEATQGQILCQSPTDATSSR